MKPLDSRHDYDPDLSNGGFTTIELVVIMLLIGVLAVTAAPRFFNQQSNYADTYQLELLSTLRLAQWQQMNLLASEPCLTLSLSSTSLSPQSSCAAPPQGLTVTIPSADQAAVSFSGPASIQFGTEGLPIGSCSGGCTITITDIDNSEQVQINSEGYIYAP